MVQPAQPTQENSTNKWERLTGFSLNIGDATQSFVEETLSYLFDYANSITGFYLYISMDIYASGAACYAGSQSCNGPYDYASIFGWVLTQPSYYKGPSGNPMISSTTSNIHDHCSNEQ
jgi:hypothetical protein